MELINPLPCSTVSARHLPATSTSTACCCYIITVPPSVKSHNSMTSLGGLLERFICICCNQISSDRSLQRGPRDKVPETYCTRIDVPQLFMYTFIYIHILIICHFLGLMTPPVGKVEFFSCLLMLVISVCWCCLWFATLIYHVFLLNDYFSLSHTVLSFLLVGERLSVYKWQILYGCTP